MNDIKNIVFEMGRRALDLSALITEVERDLSKDSFSITQDELNALKDTTHRNIRLLAMLQERLVIKVKHQRDLWGANRSTLICEECGAKHSGDVPYAVHFYVASGPDNDVQEKPSPHFQMSFCKECVALTPHRMQESNG